MAQISDPAVSVCFSVRVDGHDLGVFTGCSGLGCEVAIETREEGGNHLFVHQLPGRIKYTNVRLTRPLDGLSAKVAQWFASMATLATRTTVEITARRADGSVVATWNLADVVPVRWTAPEFNSESPRAALETLELAHHGFLPTGAVAATPIGSL